jgi:hypothetical protein
LEADWYFAFGVARGRQTKRGNRMRTTTHWFVTTPTYWTEVDTPTRREHGGFGGVVTFRSDDGPKEVIGDISFIENAHGDWLINVVDNYGNVIVRTFIENVERIVVL